MLFVQTPLYSYKFMQQHFNFFDIHSKIYRVSTRWIHDDLMSSLPSAAVDLIEIGEKPNPNYKSTQSKVLK